MTETESMVERVAKAIQDALPLRPHDEVAMHAARAVIEVMKEPTFAMVEAPAALEVDPGTADDVWQVMIDKALEE